MVFSSTAFLFVFLPVVLSGYFLIRKDLRNTFLLIMSLLFYAAGEPKFVFVMMASIAVNYFLGLLIWKTKSNRLLIRRLILLLAVSINLGLLFYNKYFDFAITNINRILNLQIELKNIILPIGISFFTFQGMSYVLDVYMDKASVQKNPLNIALYIALFPQLIAGPIVRYSDINNEIINRKTTLNEFSSGIQRFAVGLSKKVILANQFALLADIAFSKTGTELGAGLAWLGAISYTLQIYFDFSGYSDMAIGLGLMFGFHFKENFDYPYTSTSVSVFWRKWHISLSSWFRDYVYIPLGGNRRGNVYVHLMIVFILTGLWHGASWHFVAWGLWHGMFLILERILRNRKISVQVPQFIKWLYTMLVVVIGWVFFRAEGFYTAFDYLKCMFGFYGATPYNVALRSLINYAPIFVIGVLAMLPWVRWYQKIINSIEKLKKTTEVLTVICCFCLLILGITFTVSSTYNPFIYFNF